MKRLTIAALVAAQTMTAQPALSADLGPGAETRAGAFGGFRLRVPLDGARGERRVRAGLAIAPAIQSRAATGESRLRIGEGLELGLAGPGPVRLSLAGQDLRRLGAVQDDQDGERGGGPSTLGWIAIGVGVVTVLVVGAAALCLSDRDCIPSE